MKVDYYKTKDKILQKYIEGYYFIEEVPIQKKIKYCTYPSNYSIFCIQQNVEKLYKENQIVYKSSLNKNLKTELFFRYSKPLRFEYENVVNEITIYFRPLGINYFIKDLDLSKTAKISNLSPFPDFEQSIQEIFAQPSRELQIIFFENYWLSKLLDKDFILMYNIVGDLEQGLSIIGISEKYNFTRQYITKLFLKNIGKTPSEYRKIFRFRSALKQLESNGSLTSVSYKGEFYDQAHFIKCFKSLTDIKPSCFLKKVDLKKGNIWRF